MTAPRSAPSAEQGAQLVGASGLADACIDGATDCGNGRKPGGRYAGMPRPLRDASDAVGRAPPAAAMEGPICGTRGPVKSICCMGAAMDADGRAPTPVPKRCVVSDV